MADTLREMLERAFPNRRNRGQPMTGMTSHEIMERAARVNELVALIDSTPNLDSNPEEAKRLGLKMDALISPLTAVERLLLLVAQKILEGTPFAVATDNPETAHRSRVFAGELGLPYRVFPPGREHNDGVDRTGGQTLNAATIQRIRREMR
jgi:hypothetical protein